MNSGETCNDLRQVTPFLGQRATRGYTLVEIMIVVTIIGLLAAVALPNFLKHRNSARVKSCIQNLRVLDGAKAQWALEAGKATASIPTTNDVIPYLRDGRMPECPANGSYRLRSLARIPLCSLYPEGHTIRNLNADDDPSAD